MYFHFVSKSENKAIASVILYEMEKNTKQLRLSRKLLLPANSQNKLFLSEFTYHSAMSKTPHEDHM